MAQQLSLTLDPNGSNSMSQGARAASIAQAKEGNQITMTYGGQKMGEIHEFFILALSLVWFAGA